MTQGQHSMLLGGLAVGLLGAAAYLFFTRGSSRAEFPTQYSIDGVCLSCKSECKTFFNEGETPPLICPNCDQRAVHQWSYCFECNRRFVATPAADGKPPMIPICTDCGSGRTGAFDPVDPRQQPTGDAKLPPFP